MNYQRNEYPRPQFRRDDWMSLNGEWEFCFDDLGEGEFLGYPTGRVALEQRINVPFTYQYAASGIGDESIHETVWYRRTFTFDKKGVRSILCFNGSDYVTDVWVNGKHAITHTGAYAPFSADITKFVKKGDNVIVVRCYDPFDPTIPRGKQSWTGKKFACWYIPNTGIWQSVWIEYCGDDGIANYTLTPDIDTCSFSGEITTMYAKADELEISVSYKGNLIKKQRVSLDGKHTRYTVRLMELDFVDESFFWTPENPNLFYVDFRLFTGNRCVDVAHTRFGMRKVSVDNAGNICLNNRKLYQRLILDQGYWDESGITPPSAESLKQDIELSKAMGYNGARKHQKFEDPYFYYYADELGFLTWCEMPSAYNFNATEVAAITNEWQEIVAVARNFTSTVCYVPLNESWGVRKIIIDENQQNFARSLYFLTKALDKSRLVSTNDGWENIDATDILSIHDYAFDASQFEEKYFADNYDGVYPQGRKLMALGHEYLGQPVLFTEFGGIAMQREAHDGNWGYNTGASNDEEFIIRYRNLLKGVYATKEFQGFCYTQLTDVQQEVNGLLYPDRTPKFDLETIRKITENRE